MAKKKKDDKVWCPLCGKTRVDWYDICDVCRWEYDPDDLKYPEEEGAWYISLNEAKIWYAKYGRGWKDVWWSKLVDHYGGEQSDAYKAWHADESGWKPEP